MQALKSGGTPATTGEQLLADPDTELAFVREFSVGGLVLAGNISAEDKRERIRVAIYTHRRENALFAPGETYAQAFRRCYGRPCEMRKRERDRHGRPILLAPLGDEHEDDDDDTDEDPSDSDYGTSPPRDDKHPDLIG